MVRGERAARTVGSWPCYADFSSFHSFLPTMKRFFGVLSLFLVSGPLAAQSVNAGTIDPCGTPAFVRKLADPSGLNLVDAISVTNLPTIGNQNFEVKLDDPADTCGITPGVDTWLLVAEEPLQNILVAGAGCAPGSPGLLVIDVTSDSYHVSGPSVWAGPGFPACHSLVIPDSRDLCGIRCVGQGLFIDPSGPSGPFVLTEPLRFGVGS